MTDIHKVFISYYHADDQFYKNELQRLAETAGIFVDKSVNPTDIKDEGLTDQQIRKIIRDNYLKNSTVTVVLIGKNTAGRKHVDWEIHASMSDIGDMPKSGLLVVNLPSIHQRCRSTNEYERSLIGPYDNYSNPSTIKDFDSAFPYMPSRLIDNFVKGVPICVVNWSTISTTPSVLKQLIQNAFERRKTNNYDTSKPLRKSNSSLR